jgi:hypothetical protein
MQLAEIVWVRLFWNGPQVNAICKLMRFCGSGKCCWLATYGLRDRISGPRAAKCLYKRVLDDSALLLVHPLHPAS